MEAFRGGKRVIETTSSRGGANNKGAIMSKGELKKTLIGQGATMGSITSMVADLSLDKTVASHPTGYTSTGPPTSLPHTTAITRTLAELVQDELPVELKFQVLSLVLSDLKRPRIVTVTLLSDGPTPVFRVVADIPVILHICKPLRNEGMKRYGFLMNRSLTISFYFSTDVDTLVMSSKVADRWVVHTNLGRNPMSSRFRCLAITGKDAIAVPHKNRSFISQNISIWPLPRRIPAFHLQFKNLEYLAVDKGTWTSELLEKFAVDTSTWGLTYPVGEKPNRGVKKWEPQVQFLSRQEICQLGTCCIEKGSVCKQGTRDSDLTPTKEDEVKFNLAKKWVNSMGRLYLTPVALVELEAFLDEHLPYVPDESDTDSDFYF